MPNALWSGTVSFGLVTIPVQLVPATRPTRPRFHMLHDKDNQRLERKMFCPKHKQIVDPEDIVRGFEVARDEFVVVTDEELESLSPERSRSIEISDFVDASAIPPVYYDRPYYLTPTGAKKPYSLLVKTLEENNKAGITRFVFHEREYLAAVRAIGGALCLCLLRFDDDVQPSEDLASHAKPDPRRAKAISKQMQLMTGTFNLKKYKDEQEERVKELLAKKARRGKRVKVSAEAEQATASEPEELIETLQKSLRKARSRKSRKK